MAVRICVLYLIIVIKSDIWIISNCLGLHVYSEILVFVVCRTMLLGNLAIFKRQFIIYHLSPKYTPSVTFRAVFILKTTVICVHEFLFLTFSVAFLFYKLYGVGNLVPSVIFWSKLNQYRPWNSIRYLNSRIQRGTWHIQDFVYNVFVPC